MTDNTSIHPDSSEKTPFSPQIIGNRWRFGPGDGKVNSIACFTFDEAQKSMLFSMSKSKYIAVKLNPGNSSPIYLNIGSIAARTGLTKKQINSLKDLSEDKAGTAIIALLKEFVSPQFEKVDILKTLGPLTRRNVEEQKKNIETVIMHEMHKMSEIHNPLAIQNCRKTIVKKISLQPTPETILALISLYHSDSNAAIFMRNRIPNLIEDLIKEKHLKDIVSTYRSDLMKIPGLSEHLDLTTNEAVETAAREIVPLVVKYNTTKHRMTQEEKENTLSDIWNELKILEKNNLLDGVIQRAPQSFKDDFFKELNSFITTSIKLVENLARNLIDLHKKFPDNLAILHDLQTCLNELNKLSATNSSIYQELQTLLTKPQPQTEDTSSQSSTDTTDTTDSSSIEHDE